LGPIYFKWYLIILLLFFRLGREYISSSLLNGLKYFYTLHLIKKKKKKLFNKKKKNKKKKKKKKIKKKKKKKKKK